MNNERLPKILVVSNNCFSNIKNNGKTLASFFDTYPKDKIAQLYFKNETPDHEYYLNYFRITDKNLVEFRLLKKDICGCKIKINNVNKDINIPQKVKANSMITTGKKIIKCNITRNMRELLWSEDAWKTKALELWIEDFKPDIIFFCAGDSGFAYDIVEYIKKTYSTKLVTYSTDDYILPRKYNSWFGEMRRRSIEKKVRSILSKTEFFLTISDEMRNIYKDIFNKDSEIVINMTETLKTNEGNVNERIELVYAGGLHYNRYMVLNRIGESLKKYNSEIKNDKDIFLKIYSADEISNKIKKKY